MQVKMRSRREHDGTHLKRTVWLSASRSDRSYFLPTSSSSSRPSVGVEMVVLSVCRSSYASLSSSRPSSLSVAWSATGDEVCSLESVLARFRRCDGRSEGGTRA